MTEDKQGIVVILVICAIIGLIIARMIFYINNQEKTYEYALNGKIGVSSNCYVKEDITYCQCEDKVIQVDNYYEVE